MIANGNTKRTSPRHKSLPGFTLVELLVVITVIIVLAAVSFSLAGSSIRKARAVQCGAVLKGLGGAVLLYTQDHNSRFPRSFHSAGAHREPGWAVSIAPYLGISEERIENDWKRVFNEQFRSPSDDSTDPNIYSYALNVHFELDPDGDDYKGSPATWHFLHQVSAPEATVMMAQTRPVSYGDHLMCHQWSGIKAAKNALNHDIHDGKANYLFADGHVELIKVEETIDPSRKLNRWNPSLAR